MLRFLFIICLAISAMSMGCCGPGCNTSRCNDCDGLSLGSNVVPSGPLQNLRQMKRQLTCGSGCGEVYAGEWISTPPDCNDPCCDSQWVGGAVKARPFCWQRGALASSLFGNMVGGRYCSGEESSAPCGCGECDSGGGCLTGSCGARARTSAGGCSSGNCGASLGTGSSCGCGSSHLSSVGMRNDGRQAGQMMQAKAMDARVNRIRQ